VADDVQVQSQGPSGNGFSLDLKQRSLGITGPIVIPVLCLLLLGVLGWLRSKDLNEQLKALGARQEQIRTELREQNTLVAAQTEALRGELREQNAILHAQSDEVRNEFRAQNRTMADQAVTAQQALVAQMQGVAERLSILSYNMNKPPEDRLPLEVSPSLLPPPPERGR
jgi:Tfp pilus assembly protein PilO